MRLLLALTLLFHLPLLANTDTRSWNLENGEVLRAELVTYDAEHELVELLINDTQTQNIQLSLFSDIDQAWILEWNEIDAEIQELNATLDGTLGHLVIEGEFQTDLHLYYPSTYTPTNASTYPLMILFNAGGKSLRYLRRHMEAAEQAGIILACCGQFRNTADHPVKEEQFLRRFREVFATIQSELSYDPEQVFMGGNSGGAWRAYHYSAWIDYPWAGIYANGGWLGGAKYAKEDYADNMRIVMVNGNNDKAANRVIPHDTAILEKHHAEIALIAFEGGHQVPPTRSQVKAFKWLLSGEEFDEKASQ